jgi:hypothetical protein
VETVEVNTGEWVGVRMWKRDERERGGKGERKRGREGERISQEIEGKKEEEESSVSLSVSLSRFHGMSEI